MFKIKDLKRPRNFIPIFLLFIALIFFWSASQRLKEGKRQEELLTLKLLEQQDQFDIEERLQQNIDRNIFMSVINIWCTSDNIYEDDSGGSGILIGSGGLIITNSHIIPQNTENLSTSNTSCAISIPNADTGIQEEIYLAQPILLSELSNDYDLAFLQIYDVYTDEDNIIYGQYPNTFSYFDLFGDDVCKNKDIKIGENVRILGYPAVSGGSNLTITEGVVSSYTDKGLIMTSAKIDQGNSGGIAIDDSGCLIGIPVAIVTSDFGQLGIIIPVWDVAEFIISSQDFFSDIIN